ncbi:glycosyltransferase family 25 protein [Gayadomonas joobiniege]|uniref:glycosyltransferase family 25 protein n=1 Tax=Gayadomonas joobiniege TaxID=1234606 RepID=UPI00037883C2|nr:glycosyltransferase family 25 protein [Gayadomonas joobiniege]
MNKPQGKVFLINLDSSQDRYAFMAKQLTALAIPFERVAAVDGRILSKSEIDAVYSTKQNQNRYFKPLNNGEIGCYLSHRLIWQKIIGQNLPWAIILEDDSIINKNLCHVHGVFEHIKNWDYIKLTYLKDQSRITESLAIPQIPPFKLIQYSKIPITTKAQAVSLTGAKKLLKATERICRPIDVDIQNYWDLDIQVLGLSPAVIERKETFTSDIKKTDLAINTINKPFLKKIKYRVRYEWQLKKYKKQCAGLGSFLVNDQ